MTKLFSIMTMLTLIAVAVFAQLTGMASSSYIALILCFGLYLGWQYRQQPVPVKIAREN